jgi:hypothetical protein
MTHLSYQTQFSAVTEVYMQRLLAQASGVCLPELFVAGHPNALYYLPSRNGVSVIALHTHDLNHDQLKQILTYRLAQYLVAGHIDARMVFDKQLLHEPLENVDPDDIHIIAGLPESGQLLCYAVIKAAADDEPAVTMGAAQRSLLPVEQHFGHDIFKDLDVLPEIPVRQVREIGRFVKNQQLAGLKKAQVRAPTEVMVAMLRLLTGPLVSDVRAIVGDIHPEGSVKCMLDFFHIPVVIVKGVVPTASENDYLLLHYHHGSGAPFAISCADLSVERLVVVERALELPGTTGLQALLMLKSDIRVATSIFQAIEERAPLLECAA